MEKKPHKERISASASATSVVSAYPLKPQHRNQSQRDQQQHVRKTKLEGKQSGVIPDEEQDASKVEPEEPAVEIPETIAVPGRKRDKRPGPLKTSNLQGRVIAIWTNLQQCGRDIFNPAILKIINRFNDVYTDFCKIIHQQTHLFLAEVQGKLVVTFNPMLLQSLNLRWASLTERAMYNLMVTLPQDIMPQERLREKARKDIGK